MKYPPLCPAQISGPRNYEYNEMVGFFCLFRDDFLCSYRKLKKVLVKSYYSFFEYDIFLESTDEIRTFSETYALIMLG